MSNLVKDPEHLTKLNVDTWCLMRRFVQKFGTCRGIAKWLTMQPIKKRGAGSVNTPWINRMKDKALGVQQPLRDVPCIRLQFLTSFEVNECISGLYNDSRWPTAEPSHCCLTSQTSLRPV
ncbi:hypothetical protein KIN20_015283 [Parelaphostrongylus tenuis]|uniref:Uncharacterized protein n=1 Tax=Parelaphostrongylus tenuis TaxID=148309 RepID=A0AAD5MX65_PARTN|nr:hypothetical protein KIN20_015283 [Parelaphostrongylus tenuis]